MTMVYVFDGEVLQEARAFGTMEQAADKLQPTTHATEADALAFIKSKPQNVGIFFVGEDKLELFVKVDNCVDQNVGSIFAEWEGMHRSLLFRVGAVIAFTLFCLLVYIFPNTSPSLLQRILGFTVTAAITIYSAYTVWWSWQKVRALREEYRLYIERATTLLEGAGFQVEPLDAARRANKRR